jgi:hypothetical protein
LVPNGSEESQPAKSERAGAKATNSVAAAKDPSDIMDAIFAMAFEWLMSVSFSVCLSPRWGVLSMVNTF